MTLAALETPDYDVPCEHDCDHEHCWMCMPVHLTGVVAWWRTWQGLTPSFFAERSDEWNDQYRTFAFEVVEREARERMRARA